jgi:hypothetical protein
MNDIIYAQTARFDEARALTEDEMRQAAPSIFATTAHESRSNRFAPIPTIEVLRALAREGFMPVGARQCVARAPTRESHTKHLIRLRRLDGDQVRVGDTVTEMLLKNANDGSSVYDLMAGLFRVRCLNSLVVQRGTIDEVRVKHVGKDTVSQVIEGTYRVLAQAEHALAAPESWQALDLGYDRRIQFAELAHVARFGVAEQGAPAAITPEALLRPRRDGDKGTDLWTTFNVVQENAMRGGLDGQGRDRNGRERRFTSRPIKGIDQDVRLNKALWKIAEAFAEELA